MDSFVSRKRRRVSPSAPSATAEAPLSGSQDSTDVKLAILSSLYPNLEQSHLLDILITSDGSVESACQTLTPSSDAELPVRKRAVTGIQSPLSFGPNTLAPKSTSPTKSLTKKGKTLHLYAPSDIAAHTPCSVIHNFLPAGEATSLLKELLSEAVTFPRATFKLFDNVVQSPHTACFYVDNFEEEKTQKTEYLYNGGLLDDVRQLTPELRKVKSKVRDAVNAEIQKRIKESYPDGRKLRFQSPRGWQPNAAFVNCYDGAAQSVGYHTDQLTYLGPRAVIGSLSLGVAREFRVRRVVARDAFDSDEKISNGDGNSISPTKKNNSANSPSPTKKTSRNDKTRADAEGQIAIHLPHNSLLVMHAEMQEEWKHSVAPAQAIDPHPIGGNKRINVTYRWYRDSLHPKYTPKCRCGVATVLRCVQRKKENKGRYMWMCHVNQSPGKDGCGFFQWAEFDDDGEPPWSWEKVGDGVERTDEGMIK